MREKLLTVKFSTNHDRLHLTSLLAVPARHLLLWLVFLLMMAGPSLLAQGYEIDVRISDGDDDAEEQLANGELFMSSSDIELAVDGSSSQYVGFRFTQIDIPRGARIVSAYLEFAVEEYKSEATSLSIRGQKSPDAAPFVDVNYNLTSRPRTAAAVAWTNLPTYAIGDVVKTPNLRPIVQEIVGQQGWQAGNDLAFFIDGTGRRNFHSYDGDKELAPRLVVVYDDTELVANKVRTYNWTGWNNQPFGHSPDPAGCTGSWSTTWTLFRGTAPFTLTEYDNGTIIAEGNVEQIGDASKRFDFYMVLHNARNWADWSALGRTYYAGTNANCSANHGDWTYYETDSERSRWIGTNGYAHEGKVSKITHRPSDLHKGVQKGFGSHNGSSNSCEQEQLRGWMGLEGDYHFVCGDYSAFINGYDESSACHLQNSGLEAGLDHWSYQSSNVSLTADAFTGTQAAALVADNAYLRQTNLPAEPGVIYEFTAMTKVVSPATGDYLRIQFFDKYYQLLQESQTTVTGDKWHLEKVAAKAPEGTTNLAVQAGKWVGGETRYDDLCVQIVEDYVYSDCSDRLKNPSFESDMANWANGQGNASITTDAVIDTKALKMSENTTESAFTYQLFNSAPGETISFDFWAKRQIVSGSWAEPRIKLVYYRGYNDIIDYTYTSVTSTDWKEYNVTGTTPPGTVSVMIVFNNFPGQVLWADGGCIRTVDPIVVDAGTCAGIQNPSFEGGLTNWTTTKPDRTTVVSNAGTDGQKALRIDGYTNFWQEAIPVQEGQWYELSADVYAPYTDEHMELHATFKDAAYNILETSEFKIISFDWETKSMQLQAPQGATQLVLGGHVETDDGEYVYYDNFCLRTITSPATAGFEACEGCQDNLYINGGFEYDGGANDFDNQLLGIPMEVLENGNQSIGQWSSATRPEDYNYYLNDANDVVNNPEGDRFLYMPSAPNCLVNKKSIHANMELEEGQEYQFCFYAAAYSADVDSDGLPTGTTVEQKPGVVILETDTGAGVIPLTTYFLPKAISIHQLRWIKCTYNFVYDGSSIAKNAIFSAATDGVGVAFDGISLSKVADCPAVPENCWADGLMMEFYNVPGTAIDDLYGHLDYPANPDATDRTVSGAGFTQSRGDNYITRTRGYLQAPATGTYHFNATGDDRVRVLLSSDHTAGKREKIIETTIYIPTGTHDAQPSQTSGAIELQAGSYYYIEILHREIGGGDAYQVYWKTPTAPGAWAAIPNGVLTPYACPPEDPYVEVTCDDGMDVEVYYTGLHNNVPASVVVPNASAVSEARIDVVYHSGNPGNTLNVLVDGVSHTLQRSDVGASAWLYSGIVDGPVGTVSYTDDSLEDKAQSLVVTATRTNVPGKWVITRDWLEAKFWNDTRIKSFPLPPSDYARTVKLQIPVSEITLDGRSFTFTATAGGVSETVTKTYDNNSNLPGGCCVDLIELVLQNVAPDAATLTVEAVSPQGGQSILIGGAVTIDVACAACPNDRPVLYASTDYVCSTGESISFHTDGGTGQDFQWDFGAGATPATATGAGPHTVTYGTAGASRVSLTATEGDCTTFTATNYVYIAQPEFCAADLAVSCEDGLDVETIVKGINNNIPATVIIPDGGSVVRTSVEIIYEDNNPGSSVTITDNTGTTHTLYRLPMNSGGFLYRKVIDGSISSVSYADTSYQGKAQAIVLSVQRTGVAGRQVLSRSFTGGGNPHEITERTFTLPAGDAPRNVTVHLPITELTADGRNIRAIASIGGQSQTIERTYGAGGDTMADGCCVDIFDFSLDNVPANATELTIRIEPFWANGKGGQSYVLGGSVAFDVECACADGTAPSISQSKSEVCVGEAVTFSVNTVDGLSAGDYSWTFGTGATPAAATGQGPHSVTYSGTGPRTIALEAADATCYQTAITSVVVGSTANFTSAGGIAGNESGCGAYDPGVISSTANPSGTSAAPDYQWQSRTAGGSWTDIPGGLYIDPGTITETTEYRRGARAGDCVPYVWTNAVTKTVTNNPSNPGTISGDQSNCGAFDPAAISSTALPSGHTGTLIYRWQQQTTAGWSSVSGATGASFDPPYLTETTNYRRLARVDGCSGWSYSAPITITVIENVTDAGAISGDELSCGAFDPAAIVSDAAPTGSNVSFSWQQRPGTSGPWTVIAGATAPTYDPGTIAVTTQYRRRANIAGCSNFEVTGVVTKSVRINVTDAGSIGSDETGCDDYAAALIVSVTDASGHAGGDLIYAWQSRPGTSGSWATISGATGASYDPGTVDQTTQYRRLARTAGCSGNNIWQISNVVTKVSKASPIANITVPSVDTLCAGTSHEFEAFYEEWNPADYAWDFGPYATVSTATGAGSHTVEFDVPGNAAYTVNMVTVSVTRDGCTTVDTMFVKLQAQPEISATTESANTSCVQPNGTLQLTVDNPAAVPFQASIDGGATWAAANQTVFDGLNTGDYELYIRFDDGACASRYGTVSIAGPTALTAQADTFTGACPGLALEGNVLDNDQAGAGVEVSIITPATAGIANISPDGELTYVPNAAVCGTDQLTYRVCDTATDCCATATVSIVYEDDVAPTMSVPSSTDTIYCDEAVPAAPFVFGFDNCTQVAVTSEEVETPGTDNCNNYTITRTWTATDPCGNVGQTVQTIHVVDAAAPEIFRIHKLAGGQQLVAGTTERVSHRWKTVMFPTYFATPPVVLTQVASQNEQSAVVAQVRNVTSTQFEVRLREEDANDNVHANENVTWTAITGGDLETGTVGVNQYATPITFADAYADAPHVFAAAQTTADEDAAVVRQSDKDKLGVALRLQEETSADANTAHSTEQVGYLVIAGDGDLTNAAGEIIGERGSVNVSHEPKTIILAHTYHNPVVIASSLPLVGSQQATVRIKQVSANSFELYVQEFDYLDGGHAVEPVSYLVVEGSLPLSRSVDCAAIPAPLTAGVELVAVDNCGQTELTLEVVSADASCGNDVVYRYAAADMCGNMTSLDQVLTVIDTVAPTFVVPADYSLACSEDRHDLSLTGAPTAIADNCTDGLQASYTDDESGLAFCNGPVLRRWKVTDACGNTTVQVQVITVVDDRDTDGDGTPDAIDFDTDNDGIADVYELDIDTDGDGIPNYQDLDSDNDGLTDLIEAGYPDINGDGIVDNYLLADWDKDQDGFADGFDGNDNDADSLATHTFDPLSGTADRDGDGIPNYRDLDSDNDGITDLVEAQGADADGDGRVDYDPLTEDADSDGLADLYDTDTDTLAGIEAPARALVLYNGVAYVSGLTTVDHDADGDYLPNFWDVDSDNDGISDLLEAGGVDATGNGKVDIGAAWDDNGDGLHDAYNSFPLVRTDADGATIDGRAEDTDGNGTVYLLADVDTDGLPNYVDADSDGDGILDLWEIGLTHRDADMDGRLNAVSDLNRDGFDDQLVDIAFLSTEPMLPGTGTRPSDGTDGNQSPYVTTHADGLLAPANGEPDVDNDGDGLLNHVDTDSDDDGLLDAVEDANQNGIREANETYAYGADTDGDLIVDGVEDANQDGQYTTDETDPRNPDTDGDGLQDGAEDANQNGRVSLGESDPRDACDPVPSGNCIGMALRLKVRLQGAMVDAQGGLMRDDLRRLGYLPLTEPYTAHPNFEHQPGMGGETVTDSTIFLVEGSDAIVDWVFIELRDHIDPSIIYYSRSALLQRDGDVVDVDGVTEVLEWPDASGGQFVVNIRHRSHLGAMLSIPVFLSPTPNFVDFTDPATPLKGAYATYEKNGERMLWAGDFNGDQLIGFQGPNNDLQELTLAVMLDPANLFYLFNFVKPGYHGPDYNMDGKTIFQGWLNDRNPLLFHTLLNVQDNDEDLINFVLFQDVPEDDEYYTGAYTWTDCYELDFPITVKLTNGNAPVLRNPNQLSKLIEDDADILGILLPFDLVSHDGEVLTMIDSLAVTELPMDCMDDEPEYYYGGYTWEGCFELQFPLTLKLDDGSTVLIEDADDYAEAHEDNNGEDDAALVAVALPFEVLYDGNTVQINTADDMAALLEACSQLEAAAVCWEGGYIWADCYALHYPATFTLPGGSTKTANNNRQFFDIHHDDAPSGMVFPITLKKQGEVYVANDSTELMSLVDSCYTTPYYGGEFAWNNCYELQLPVMVKLINGRFVQAQNFNKLQKWQNEGMLGLVYPFSLKAAGQHFQVSDAATLEQLLDACGNDTGYWQGDFDVADIFALAGCYQFQQPVIFQHTDGYQVSASNQGQFDQVVTDAAEELNGLYFPIHLYADGQTIAVADMTHLGALLQECLDIQAEPVVEVWSGAAIWADCYGLDYPVTFAYPSGATVEAHDDYTYYGVLSNTHPAGLLFPISLSHNGTTVVANNAAELEALVAGCDAVPYWGNDFDWSDCYQVRLPVTFKMKNGTLRSAAEVADALAYTQLGTLGLIYPFQLTDGNQDIPVNNEAEAQALIEACASASTYWAGNFKPIDIMAIEQCYSFDQPIAFRHKNGNDVSAASASELQNKIGSLNGKKLAGIYFPVYLLDDQDETIVVDDATELFALIGACEDSQLPDFYTGSFDAEAIFDLDECYYFTQPVTFLHKNGYTINAITENQLEAQADEDDLIGVQFPIYLYGNGQTIVVQDIGHLNYLIDQCDD